MPPARSTSTDAGSRPRPLLFPVVGIGASAGGLAAVGSLFERMPASPGMAFVVILHLSPDHESTADAILQRSTSLPVRQLVADAPILPDNVYVIAPAAQLRMDGGMLRVSPLERKSGTPVTIDLFFRSLAEAHRERAVAIVLSGTGFDGSQGLRYIKESGGVSLVQSPTDAEYDMMPLNAMATGVADFVLTASDMPHKLVELWTNAQKIQLPEPPEDLRVRDAGQEQASAQQAFRDILTVLYERTGHDFKNYKHATVLRRFERRMQVCRQATLPDYLIFLQTHVEEARSLLQDMLISVTAFFRDADACATLSRALVSDVFGDGAGPAQVRAWVAGCATGEEAYSIALMLVQQAVNMAPQPVVQIFASDVDERAIAVARAGIYSESIVADVQPDLLREFFHYEAGHYRVSKSVRERVTFSVHNLLRDPPFSRMNLVCCRNLLIYLNREAQRQVFETLSYALLPGGLLFLGNSETADMAPDLFEPVDKRHRIYRSLPRPRTSERLLSTLGSTAHLGGRGVADPTRDRLMGEIHQQLMQDYAPPSAVVDASLKIVHLSTGSSRFVMSRARAGEGLLDVVLSQLRSSLEAALEHAVRTGESVEAERVRVDWQDQPMFVNMLVRPLRHPQAVPNSLLVMFLESEAAAEAAPDIATSPRLSPPSRGDQLNHVQGQLLRFIGDSATSAEELRAANEELQSLNEELRSATEELETSKEELQSVNEELTTVNYELKNKVDETAKANDDLKNLIDANAIATVFVDAKLRIKRFTPQASAVFNLIASDVGRPLLDITHRLRYDGLARDAREAFRSLQTIEREVCSEEGRWYLARLQPYRTLEDRIEGAVLNFIDVTERREAQERLRAGEARMSLVAETTRDFAIVTLDALGLITSWNNGAELMFGHSEAGALGRPGSMIFSADDRRSGVPEVELRRAHEHGRVQDERWYLRKDGTQVYSSGVMMALPAPDDGYAKILRDMTDTKRAQEQREALLLSEQSLRAQLELANRQKDEFLAIMSHELKNPLNLIALNADLLQRLPETRVVPAAVRIAQTLRASVHSQAQIINDLLDLSRIQTGKLSLNRGPVGFHEVVQRISEAMHADAEAKHIELSLTIGPGPFDLNADPVRLEQIVWNLVSNAIKFTPVHGKVQLELQGGRGNVCLTVSDNGRGIEPHVQGHLFEMFFQGESGAARREGGLGIGLALTKRLVDMHGGTVQVESEGAGKGSRFTLTLPRDGTLPQHFSPAGPSGPSVVAGRRLLLVDDELDSLQAFEALLTLEGAQVRTASSGKRALEIAAQETFDILLCDLAMPGMDGYTVIAKMREAGHAMPAIAVTGMGRTSDRQRVEQAGFAELVSKPVELDALMAAVGRSLA